MLNRIKVIRKFSKTSINELFVLIYFLITAILFAGITRQKVSYMTGIMIYIFGIMIIMDVSEYFNKWEESLCVTQILPIEKNFINVVEKLSFYASYIVSFLLSNVVFIMICGWSVDICINLLFELDVIFCVFITQKMLNNKNRDLVLFSDIATGIFVCFGTCISVYLLWL